MSGIKYMQGMGTEVMAMNVYKKEHFIKLINETDIQKN